MILIRNPKIIGKQAFAELDVRTGCCCKTIYVVADIRDDKIITNIINLETFQEIYVGLWQDLINEWEKIL